MTIGYRGLGLENEFRVKAESYRNRPALPQAHVRDHATKAIGKRIVLPARLGRRGTEHATAQ